jgi:hypothetical protein
VRSANAPNEAMLGAGLADGGDDTFAADQRELADDRRDLARSSPWTWCIG